jgi:hypothetical protein
VIYGNSELEYQQDVYCRLLFVTLIILANCLCDMPLKSNVLDPINQK